MKKYIAILFAICGLFLTACQPKLSPEQKKAELLQVFEWQNKMKNWVLNEGVQNTFSHIDEMTPRQIEKYYGKEYSEYKLVLLTAYYLNQFENTPSVKKILKDHPERPLKKEIFERFTNDALDTKIGLYKENVFEALGSRGFIAPTIYKEHFDPLLAELDNMKIRDSAIKEYVKKLRTLTMLHYDEIHGFEIYVRYYDHRDQKALRQTWNNAETEFLKASRLLYINYCLPNCPFKEKDIFAPFYSYSIVFFDDN